MKVDQFEWEHGVDLLEHSKCKLQIIEGYIYDYVKIRCNPMTRHFRFAIVDFFAGGGRYKGGEEGSPLIFLRRAREAIIDAVSERHLQSKVQNRLEVECLFVFNDKNKHAVEMLRKEIKVEIEKFKEAQIKIHVEVMNEDFQKAFDGALELLKKWRIKNVFFNFDQTGHILVSRENIIRSIQEFPSSEAFLTFLIEPLLKFLPTQKPDIVHKRLENLDIQLSQITDIETLQNKKEWLGDMERLVHDEFKAMAPFFTPFSIKKNDGWRYWLLHFSVKYRAIEAYRDVIHGIGAIQSHFGRSGLNMLHYDPKSAEAVLYNFDQEAREKTNFQLPEDNIQLISEHGDAMRVDEFLNLVANETPADSKTIRSSLIFGDDLYVENQSGNRRRSSSQIRPDDIIRIPKQRLFFFQS